jgi:hypothetical protein
LIKKQHIGWLFNDDDNNETVDGMINKIGAVGDTRTGREHVNVRIELVPVSLCPP